MIHGSVVEKPNLSIEWRPQFPPVETPPVARRRAPVKSGHEPSTHLGSPGEPLRPSPTQVVLVHGADVSSGPGLFAALDEAEGVAVRVGHRDDARACADVLSLTGQRGAGLLHLGESGANVGDRAYRIGTARPIS
jgi:hypothetical protein